MSSIIPVRLTVHRLTVPQRADIDWITQRTQHQRIFRTDGGDNRATKPANREPNTAIFPIKKIHKINHPNRGSSHIRVKYRIRRIDHLCLVGGSTSSTKEGDGKTGKSQSTI